VGVVLSPQDGYVREAAAAANLQAMSRNQRDVRCGFLFGAFRSGRSDQVCKIPPSPIEKLIPNQSVLALTARNPGLAKLHVTHSKDGNRPCECAMINLRTASNLFIFNNMAERVGFEIS
jgi:hypothetical protein